MNSMKFASVIIGIIFASVIASSCASWSQKRQEKKERHEIRPEKKVHHYERAKKGEEEGFEKMWDRIMRE